MKKDISANLYQKRLKLCSKILLNVLYNYEFVSFVTMATYWVPELLFWPELFSGHLWHSILIFANGASYA